MNRRLTAILTALAMSALILDYRTALLGAREGVELCIRTAIPSLFPFFVLSIMLTSTAAGSEMLWMKPILKVLRIPKGTESLVLTGLIGGYPVGARCVSQAYEDGILSKSDAERMIVFCNQCGPAFLFGMVGSILGMGMCWLLWMIQIAGAILTAILIPVNGHTFPCQPQKKDISLFTAMGQALNVMGQVCGWIILFRVLIGFLERWVLWYLPEAAQVLITCLLEISNGTVALTGLDDIALRFLLCAGMLNFGGTCVMMQTYSAVSRELDRHHYFPGKVLQSCICLTLSTIFVGKRMILIPAVLIGCICLLKIRKNSSIPAVIGV